MMASNDEVDDLVLEVIKENPPEEQGLRPEWENHVGWHRKENIFNLRGHEDEDAASELHPNHPAQTGESNEALTEIQKTHIFNKTSFLSSASILTMLIICKIYAHKYYCKPNIMSCSLKPRKTEADLV